jgi:ubiquinone/menaquinone biosynthesis C-methylase UbiE
MTNDTSWRLGAIASPMNRLYDALRRGVNRNLVAYFNRVVMTEPRGYRVLEAGSGTAFATSLLAEYPGVKMASAIDHDLNALHEGRMRDHQLSAAVADIERLPFSDDSFDLVWNSSTFEHLPHPEETLREMIRVTRRSGYVFIGVPFVHGPLRFQRRIANTSVGIWIGTVFSLSQLESMILQAGLKPCASMTYFFRFFIGVLALKP